MRDNLRILLDVLHHHRPTATPSRHSSTTPPLDTDHPHMRRPPEGSGWPGASPWSPCSAPKSLRSPRWCARAKAAVDFGTAPTCEVMPRFRGHRSHRCCLGVAVRPGLESPSAPRARAARTATSRDVPSEWSFQRISSPNMPGGSVLGTDPHPRWWVETYSQITKRTQDVAEASAGGPQAWDGPVAGRWPR